MTTPRMSIYFETDKNGRRVAYRYAWRQLRAFRMRLAEAEALVASGEADLLTGHPFRR